MPRRRSGSERRLEDVELEFHHKMSKAGKDVFSMKKLFGDPRTQRLLRKHESITADGILRGVGVKRR